MEIVESRAFTKQISELLSDEEYRRFQLTLHDHPEMGVLIKGGGGVRKVRVGSRSKGKRGGARVIYYWAVSKHLIALMFAYSKNESEDLTPKQIEGFANLVRKEFKNESKTV